MAVAENQSNGCPLLSMDIACADVNQTGKEEAISDGYCTSAVVGVGVRKVCCQKISDESHATVGTRLVFSNGFSSFMCISSRLQRMCCCAFHRMVLHPWRHLSLSRTAADTATPHLPHWCSSIASSRALNESSRLLFRPVDSDILLRRSPSSKRRNLVFLKSMTNVNQLGCITSLPISSDWPELRLSSYSFLIYSRGTRTDKGS